MRFVKRSGVLGLLALGLIVSTSGLSGQKEKTTADGLPLLELDEAQRKKKNQPLPLLSSPPAAVTVDTARLKFFVSPLSTKRLLSDQARDAVNSLLKMNRTDEFGKIRAFVAGRGDIRVVESVIVEEFLKRRIPLPAVSIVQVGGLAHPEAQVVLEAWSEGKPNENPHGLVFLSGQAEGAEEYMPKLVPLLAKTLDKVERGVSEAGAKPADVLRVTCFLSTSGDASELERQTEKRFPGAAVSMMQYQRAPGPGFMECEAVARAGQSGLGAGLHNVEGLGHSTGYSTLGVVKAPQLVLTGLQLSFGLEQRHGKLAFERIDRTLQEMGVSTKDVVMAHLYPLSTKAAKLIRDVRGEFYVPGKPPASTLLIFQGLPSLDCTLGVELVAVKQ